MANVTKTILKEIYKKREPGCKKYDFGYLLIVGGSEHYSGAPALSALAAFRAGVDMVRITAPERASRVISTFSPNLAILPLEGVLLNENHLDDLEEITQSIKIVSRGNCAVLIGGGIGRSSQPQEVIRRYLSKIDIPAVIDADAIYAFQDCREILANKNFLLTPHGHEFYVLTGEKFEDLNLEEKIKLVQFQAEKLQATILLKGQKDIISNGKETAVNETGCALMTKGGMGETLGGIAGALIARQNSLFDAACAAAYINGAAGELAGAKYGESIMATDLIEEIPHVLPKHQY